MKEEESLFTVSTTNCLLTKATPKPSVKEKHCQNFILSLQIPTNISTETESSVKVQCRARELRLVCYFFQDYREPPEEEEMIEAERDLAEDAEWKRIQQNTFTRWANEHLKCIDKTLMSLETDLSDGLNLIALIEVLSQKQMSKHNKRPIFRSQKLENVSVALKFLEREGIKIINIDSTDIVDCKLKLILGLIWLLILHYSISMPIWDTEGEAPNDKQTPKQRLLNWVKNRIPELPIHNFTTGLLELFHISCFVSSLHCSFVPFYT